MAFCHGDITARNVLRAASGAPVLIDWEWAGLYPRGWDLRVPLVQCRGHPWSTRSRGRTHSASRRSVVLAVCAPDSAAPSEPSTPRPRLAVSRTARSNARRTGQPLCVIDEDPSHRLEGRRTTLVMAQPLPDSLASLARLAATLFVKRVSNEPSRTCRAHDTCDEAVLLRSRGGGDEVLAEMEPDLGVGLTQPVGRRFKSSPRHPRCRAKSRSSPMKARGWLGRSPR